MYKKTDFINNFNVLKKRDVGSDNREPHISPLNVSFILFLIK